MGICEMRQKRGAEHMMRNMRLKGEVSAERMLGMLMSSQARLLMIAAFGGWRELVTEKQQAALLDDVKLQLRKRGGECNTRFLAMLMGSQAQLLVKTIFSGWRELTMQRRQQSRVAQMQQSLRARGMESTKRMLGIMIGSQKDMLLKATFNVWRDFGVGVRTDRMREAGFKMQRERDHETQERMLTMMSSAQDSLLLKTSFSAWSECVYESRQRREVAAMMRNMKLKGEEGIKRMLGMLMSSQAGVLLKATFAGWQEAV